MERYLKIFSNYIVRYIHNKKNETLGKIKKECLTTEELQF